MLLPTMTYKEMYDHLAADHKKVKIKEEYLFPKAVKEFRKERRFPAWRWYEYTIPSTNNKYIIFFYAESRAFIEKPVVDYFCVVFDNTERLVIKWVAGGYKHNEDDPLMLIRQIHAYSSHFLKRYNERFLKADSLNANDIACRYLSRNKEQMMPIIMNEEINKRLEKYGAGAKYGFRVRDGFCFALSGVQGDISKDGDRKKDKAEAMLILFKTFMNESGMKDTQINAIDKEHYAAWTRYVTDLHKEAKDGIVTLRLEP